MMNRRSWLMGLLVVVAAIGFGSGFPNLISRVAYAVDSGRADASQKRLSAVQDLSLAFEDVANVIKPSVVNISAAKRISAPNTIHRIPGPMLQGPFRDFFGDEFFHRFFQQQPQQRGYVQQGAGTGVIVSDNGYILTNNHVVAGADEVTVKLTDDRSFTAEVIGTDPKTDLAVIKINATNLYPATFGDSDDLRIGQWVVAVGNPFGLSNTLTAGIVSATGRANMGIVEYEDFIQTDAAINPGNSGGPLVNIKGEVVGINAAIFTKSGGYMGIGFSIPVNLAKSVLDDLIENGRVVRGWLGVLIQDLNEGLSASFGYSGTDGALVGDVTSGSPAEKAGIKEGDILITFDGKSFKNTKQLRSLVAATEPGSKTPVEVFRDGRRATYYVQIGELEAQLASAHAEDPSDELGITVRTLTADMATQLGYDDVHGVIVTNVDPLGLAAKAGIRPNDVILKVHGTAVANVTEFRHEIGKHNLKEGVRLRIQSGPNERFAFLQSGDGHVG